MKSNLPPSSLNFFNLQTGAVHVVPRASVSDKSLQQFAPIVKGGTLPLANDCRLTVDRGAGSVFFTIDRANGAPVIGGMIVWAEADVAHGWSVLDQLCRIMFEPQLKAPPELPWCGVVVGLGATQLAPRAVLSLAPFERALAWAVLRDAGL